MPEGLRALLGSCDKCGSTFGKRRCSCTTVCWISGSPTDLRGEVALFFGKIWRPPEQRVRNRFWCRCKYWIEGDVRFERDFCRNSLASTKVSGSVQIYPSKLAARFHQRFRCETVKTAARESIVSIWKSHRSKPFDDLACCSQTACSTRSSLLHESMMGQTTTVLPEVEWCQLASKGVLAKIPLKTRPRQLSCSSSCMLGWCTVGLGTVEYA